MADYSEAGMRYQMEDIERGYQERDAKKKREEEMADYSEFSGSMHSSSSKRTTSDAYADHAGAAYVAPPVIRKAPTSYPEEALQDAEYRATQAAKGETDSPTTFNETTSRGIQVDANGKLLPPKGLHGGYLYKKRPVTIETLQLTADNFEEVRKFANFLIRRELDPEQYFVYDKLHDSWIEFYIGDWIVMGPVGEVYPVNSKMFPHTYEAASFVAPQVLRSGDIM